MSENDMGRGGGVTEEERLLISRASELSARSENSAVASSFLTPREQRIMYGAAEQSGSAGRLFMWGGYPGAQRRMALFLPEWAIGGEAVGEPLFSVQREERFLSLLSAAGCGDMADGFMVRLRLSGGGYVKLGHSDWLGALMALGLRRSALGDIAPDEKGALVFAKKETAGYIVEELHRAGRDAVRAVAAEEGDVPSGDRKFEGICTSIASPRLDGVVRALGNMSREAAGHAVVSGEVEVDYLTEKRPDYRIAPGTVLTIHGVGKFIIDRCEDPTRRGRIRLEARKYI